MNHASLVAALESQGFKVELDNTKRTALTGPRLTLPVFVKKNSGRSDNRRARRLVVHPGFYRAPPALAAIRGVFFDRRLGEEPEAYYTHSSNYGTFPKRMRHGPDPVEFGISVHVPTTEALRSVIDVLVENEPHALRGDGVLRNGGAPVFTTPNPVDDIDRARVHLESVPETERRALVLARVGQGRFRADLIAYWGACAVTDGVRDTRLVRASHILPWSLASDAQRLDVFNGLLLSPAYDHCFDLGLIGFDDAGNILATGGKTGFAMLALLGIKSSARLSKVDARHLPYLAAHRKLHGL
jgi:hypothetical protein